MDDEEDFDDEPDEEEQEQQQQQQPPPSNQAQNDKNIFKIPEIAKFDNDNMKVKSVAADTDDQFSNFNGDFLSLRNPCQIKPITIRTDYTCSVDYQKSPRYAIRLTEKNSKSILFDVENHTKGVNCSKWPINWTRNDAKRENWTKSLTNTKLYM